MQKKERKTRTMRLLSLFLAITIWTAAQSTPSYAGENNISASQQKAALPANPVHHCTYNGNAENTANWQNDTTTWNYIYFGSYPQMEVTDTATIAAIEKAIAAKRGTRKSCTDVWVNDTKYRRIWTFAGYEEDVYRYFKWQPIKWKVLDNNDNGTLFVTADRAIDCAQYFDTAEIPAYTWEHSGIRHWLNNTFYQNAFSKEEQDAISAWKVTNNDKHPYYGTTSGKDTTDKVYLLSIKEATNARYGFCGSDPYSPSRQIRPSAYAHANGLSKGSGSMFELDGSLGNSPWWLRSLGRLSDDDDSPSAATGDQAGMISDSYTYDGLGVVPALHIQASSALWSPAEADNEKTEVAAIDFDIPSNELAAGKSVKLNVIIEPQTAVNKNVIWVTSNSKYATIDKNNRLKLKKAGAGKYVSIKAIAADGSGTTSGYCEIYIMKHAVKRIKLSAPSKSVKAGRSVNIKATVKATGKNANKVLKWTSSNEKYATVDGLGKVKTKKAGKNKRVTITARATDGSNKKAKIKLKIK